MIVGFIINTFCSRGTETNVWSYAYYNQTILKNKSIIIVRKIFNNMTGPDFTEDAKLRFTQNFETYELLDEEIENIIATLQIDVCMVTCVGGNPLDYCPKNVPTITSCIFNANYPLGTLHTTISPYLSHNKCLLLPFIIHTVDTSENMRTELNIPSDSIVFGRYGGYDQFSIPFVTQVVTQVAINNPSIYFIFMNTKPFCNNISNIKFIDNSSSWLTRQKFVNTCDAMIHARSEGETFGLACGEFAISNKPIITCKYGDLAHIEILKEKAIIYTNQSDLYDILTNFNKYNTDMTENGYYEYLPEKGMMIFKNFLEQAITKYNSI